MGYSGRSKGYKFYDHKLKTIFETRTIVFFEDIEFGGRYKVKNFIFEEKSISIPESIHIDIHTPIQDEIIGHEEKTQHPHELV